MTRLGRKVLGTALGSLLSVLSTVNAQDMLPQAKVARTESIEAIEAPNATDHHAHYIIPAAAAVQGRDAYYSLRMFATNTDDQTAIITLWEPEGRCQGSVIVPPKMTANLDDVVRQIGCNIPILPLYATIDGAAAENVGLAFKTMTVDKNFGIIGASLDKITPQDGVKDFTFIAPQNGGRANVAFFSPSAQTINLGYALGNTAHDLFDLNIGTNETIQVNNYFQGMSKYSLMGQAFASGDLFGTSTVIMPSGDMYAENFKKPTTNAVIPSVAYKLRGKREYNTTVQLVSSSGWVDEVAFIFHTQDGQRKEIDALIAGGQTYTFEHIPKDFGFPENTVGALEIIASGQNYTFEHIPKDFGFPENTVGALQDLPRVFHTTDSQQKEIDILIAGGQTYTFEHIPKDFGFPENTVGTLAVRSHGFNVNAYTCDDQGMCESNPVWTMEKDLASNGRTAYFASAGQSNATRDIVDVFAIGPSRLHFKAYHQAGGLVGEGDLDMPRESYRKINLQSIIPSVFSYGRVEITSKDGVYYSANSRVDDISNDSQVEKAHIRN